MGKEAVKGSNGSRTSTRSAAPPLRCEEKHASRDKQLAGVSLAAVLEKRRLDQALSAKEFAVLVDVSYSVARRWFRLPKFPAIDGRVFWSDFLHWRQHGTERPSDACQVTAVPLKFSAVLPAKAQRILGERD